MDAVWMVSSFTGQKKAQKLLGGWRWLGYLKNSGRRAYGACSIQRANSGPMADLVQRCNAISSA